ncbi:MAG: acylphosphatase [Eubacteriales bacterium]|jgi:acylphosphatase
MWKWKDLFKKKKDEDDDYYVSETEEQPTKSEERRAEKNAEKRFRMYGDKMIRLHMVFSGMVQGVGFRWVARQAAEEIGVTGWVRNEDDGTVTMEAQGTREMINRMIDRIRDARWVQIDNIDSRPIPVDEHEYYFKVKDYW